MHETHANARRTTKQEQRIAGRPMAYWHGLLEDMKLAPAKKLDPKPDVKRLPGSHLRKFLSLLSDRGVRAPAALKAVRSLMDDLGKLHHEDALKIVVVCLDSPLPELRSKAEKSLLKLPEDERINIVESALVGEQDRSFSSLGGISESVYEGCSEAGRARLARAGLKSINRWVRLWAWGAIGSLPENERTAVVEAALAKNDFTDIAFDSIKDCPARDRARLIKAALKSHSDPVREKARDIIPTLPPNERGDLFDAVMASIWGEGVRYVIYGRHPLM